MDCFFKLSVSEWQTDGLSLQTAYGGSSLDSCGTHNLPFPDCFCIPQSIVQSAALTLLLCPVLLPGGLPGVTDEIFYFIICVFPQINPYFLPWLHIIAAPVCTAGKNNAGISALQGSGPWPLLPALSFPMAGMDFLQYHARMLGHGKVPGAYWDGPFSFRGRTAVDTPGIPALLHLLQQNTIHLPADSIRPGNRGHFHSLHQTFEPVASWRKLCTDNGNEYQAFTYTHLHLHRAADRNGDRILRPGRFYRAGSTARHTVAVQQRRPPDTCPRHYADGTYQHASLRHHRQEIPASGELYHRLARCSGHFMGNS